jgi:hypothetical protein
MERAEGIVEKKGFYGYKKDKLTISVEKRSKKL